MASAEEGPEQVAAGALKGSDGQPIVGAQLALMANPTAAQLDALEPGDELQTPFLDTVRTDARGKFALGVEDIRDLADREDNSDIVNFRVVVVGAPAPVVENFSGVVDAATGTINQAGGGTGVGSAAPEDVDLSYPAPAATADAQLVRNRFAGSSATGVRRVMSTAADIEPAYSGCTTILDADLGKRATSLARYYSRSDGVAANYTLTTNASMTFGIGVSSSKTSGFSAKGDSSVKQATGFMEDNPILKGHFNNAANADVHVKRFGIFCSYSPGFYEVRATRYESSLRNSPLSSAPTFPTSDAYCIHKQKGSKWAMIRTAATTLSGGLDVSGVIGIDLTSQSGFSADAVLTMDFPNAAGRVCGQKDSPAGSPGMLVARNAL